MSDVGFMPEGVRVILLPDPVEEVTDGGIIIKAEVTKEEEKTQQVIGTVVAIGPRVDSKFTDGVLKVGDKVLYAKFSGVFITGNDGERYRLANDEDIFAKVIKG
jgi:co-chaperonin GroES (HSP10)